MITDLKRPYAAGTAISAYRFVKPGVDDDTAVVATAATDLIIGTSEHFDVASGDMFDVFLGDIGKVKLGTGGIVRGQPLTADATGQGVLATTAGNRYAGFALKSGVAGDIVPFIFQLGVL